MTIRMYGEYEVQTAEDCTEKHCGLCEYWVTDEQCREAIAHFYADKFVKKNKTVSKKDTIKAMEFVLKEVEFDYFADLEDVIKDYFEDKQDELELEEFIG